MGSYSFGNPDDIKQGRIDGRRAFSKQFKADLVARYGEADTITGEKLAERYLQIDHRIPYQISGDSQNALDTHDFMLLDASSQRAKSWSCEHCENWISLLDQTICRDCFWAYPEEHKHVAMKQMRRVDISWEGPETDVFDKLKIKAEAEDVTIGALIKTVAAKSLL